VGRLGAMRGPDESYSEVILRLVGMEANLTARWLNTIGLLLGMAGVLIIFRWGPPQPDFHESVGLGLEDETLLPDGTRVSDVAEAARRAKRWHKIMSRVGLGLIGLGFFVQLMAVWR
jgi:hypothetical protein